MIGGEGSSNNITRQDNTKTTEDISQDAQNDLDDEIPF